jgi:hypothetical protein
MPSVAVRILNIGEKKKQGTLIVCHISTPLFSHHICVLIYWYDGSGVRSLGGLAKPINVAAYRYHTKVIDHLLPFSFSPGDWHKGSLQPPSALTKHSHFKDLSLLTLD